MDALGERIERDTRLIRDKLEEAAGYETKAKRLRAEAAEIGRLLELARLQR